MRGNKACWQCEHWGTWRIGYYTINREPHAMAICWHEKPRYIPEPQYGCSSWQRAPGTDDESYCVDPCGRKFEPGKFG